MPASVTSPADVVNLALVRVGFKRPVGNLYDGSEASKLALRIYAQERDAMLSDGNWAFAERNASPALLKQAPPGGYIPPAMWSSAYPALPWNFSYAFPGDCLKVRAVKQSPIFIPDFDPRSYTYSVDNDNAFTPPQRVILCNVPSMVLVYTGQVTDPATWDVAFVDALAAKLGLLLAPALIGLEGAKAAGAEMQMEMDVADRTQE